MTKANKPILMVGSAPGTDAEDVIRHFAAGVGDRALAYSDGETGLRRGWVAFLAATIYKNHPGIEPSYLHSGPTPTGYEDLPRFRVKEGVKEIRFDTLGYAAEAKRSYAIYSALRDAGIVPAGVRFQVCLPMPEDAVRLFAETLDDYLAIVEGYSEALGREIAAIAEAIPPQDLVLQFDINWEVLAVAANDVTGRRPMSFALPGYPIERFVGYLKSFAGGIPRAAQFGLHLCYGDLHHHHYFAPSNLEVTVAMANSAVIAAPRRIDYVHMPVPANRVDNEYFAPLRDLTIGETTLYAGLLHLSDGVPGALRRVEVLRRHYAGHLGVATECGLGHRPPDHTLADLLALHRDVADAL